MIEQWITSITAFFQQLAESQQPTPIKIPVDARHPALRR